MPSCFEKWPCLFKLLHDIKDASREECKEIMKESQKLADQQFIKGFLSNIEQPQVGTFTNATRAPRDLTGL